MTARFRISVHCVYLHRDTYTKRHDSSQTEKSHETIIEDMDEDDRFLMECENGKVLLVIWQILWVTGGCYLMCSSQLFYQTVQAHLWNKYIYCNDWSPDLLVRAPYWRDFQGEIFDLSLKILKQSIIQTSRPSQNLPARQCPFRHNVDRNVLEEPFLHTIISQRMNSKMLR